LESRESNHDKKCGGKENKAKKNHNVSKSYDPKKKGAEMTGK